MRVELKEIFDSFRTEGSFMSGEPFGSGHIHDTFRVETLEKDSDDYILQRLNNKVFRNIPQLQDNIERVTIHLRNKLLQIPGSDIKRECLSLIPSKEGRSWIVDDEGHYWRMYIFISNHHSQILHNNSLINLHTLEAARINDVKRYLYSSSACVYPEFLQT